MITRRLEADLSKRRIFELYLNLIEWGDGIWGAEAASRAYFGISAAALDATQSDVLGRAPPPPRPIAMPPRPRCSPAPSSTRASTVLRDRTHDSCAGRRSSCDAWDRLS